MAIFSNGSTSYVLSLKVLLISTCVLSMAMAMKLSVPLISQFAVSEVPLIYSFVISYLKPPYLYLVLNCIIITIVASSKLQNKLDDSLEPVSSKIVAELRTDFAAVSAVYEGEVSEVETTQKVTNGVEMTVGVDEFVISRSSWTPPVRQDSMELLGSSEKPPVSARFGHRKAVKASPEAGKALRVSKPKRQDTLESTWKTITEGRPMPLTRHLRKSDTWETRHNPPQYEPTTTTTPQKMKKSDTFHDRGSTTSNNSSLSPSLGLGKLKKDPSLSQDELNRRVEAFIKKFNEEMRLQRQESLNQYHEMIKRGAN